MTAAGVASARPTPGANRGAPRAGNSLHGSSESHPDAPLVREYLQSLIHQRQLAAVSIANYTRSLERLRAQLLVLVRNQVRAEREPVAVVVVVVVVVVVAAANE